MKFAITLQQVEKVKTEFEENMKDKTVRYFKFFKFTPRNLKEGLTSKGEPLYLLEAEGSYLLYLYFKFELRKTNHVFPFWNESWLGGYWRKEV